MKANKNGLVPLEMLKSSAANGIRKGEIRGFSPEMAANLIKKGLAKEISEKEMKAANKSEAAANPANPAA